MDDLDIYVNVERPSANPSLWKKEEKSSEDVYENMPNRTGCTSSGVQDVKKSSCRAAAVCLGLLCFLLLTGLIILVCLFTSSNSMQEAEMGLLQSSYTNLTEERDQLRTSYTNLMKEKDQLQTIYNNLIKERDQLQTSKTNLMKEKDQLQTSYNKLTQGQNCN